MHTGRRHRTEGQSEALSTALSKNVEIHEIGQGHLDTIHDLMERYADLPMDLADAPLVVAATERGEGRILSTDQRNFDTYRWKDAEPFHNLLRMTATGGR